MASYFFEAIFKALGMVDLAAWAIDGASLSRNIIFTALFFVMTMYMIMGGVKDGIEKWSTRLMTVLIGMLIYLLYMY